MPAYLQKSFANVAMPFRDRKCTWRQTLADSFEKEHGPLPDPVATNGAGLITAPSTPVLSSCVAGSDPAFIWQLEQISILLQHSSQPTCLKRSPPNAYDPFFDSSSESDQEDEETVQEWAARLLKMSARKTVSSKRMYRKQKPLLEQIEPVRPKRKCLPEQAQQVSIQDVPACKVAKMGDTLAHHQEMSMNWPKRHIRHLRQQQNWYSSPPRTPSPTSQASPDVADEQTKSSPPCRSKPAKTRQSTQQPTPEADNSSHHLHPKRSQVSPASSTASTGIAAG
ncbi:hypothetical protein F66182_7881 [Fusarium sp. NRRL 66182]|nr:hypothetical protein F66182_7881 [Fusarium sp. NRRL 66182]